MPEKDEDRGGEDEAEIRARTSGDSGSTSDAGGILPMHGERFETVAAAEEEEQDAADEAEIAQEARDDAAAEDDKAEEAEGG